MSKSKICSKCGHVRHVPEATTTACDICQQLVLEDQGWVFSLSRNGKDVTAEKGRLLFLGPSFKTVALLIKGTAENV
tara:strand:- start:69 stop:299 length:231 start_codon:yes stop_codon:yes gene_type:complete